MRIEGDTVVFKSTSDMYRAEASGIKPYTIRILDARESKELCNSDVRHITIEDVEDPKRRYFSRDIVDIYHHGSVLGKELVSIAWKHYYFYDDTMIWNMQWNDD